MGVQAYEMLSILEGTSNQAQQALQKDSKLKREDTHNLDFYFDKASTLCHVLSLACLAVHILWPSTPGPLEGTCPQGLRRHPRPQAWMRFDSL